MRGLSELFSSSSNTKQGEPLSLNCSESELTTISILSTGSAPTVQNVILIKGLFILILIQSEALEVASYRFDLV